MAKRNGGIIGPSNVPTPFTAKGTWKLSDAFNYIKAGLWPQTLGYQVNNSLRFNSGSSDSLTRTAGTFTSRDTFTVSAWVKLTGGGGPNQIPIVSFDGSNQYMAIRFNSSFQLDPISYQGSTIGRTDSSAFYRDFSAWYHVLVAIDSTQATAANRIRAYINGSEITYATTTYPSQNADMISTSMTTIRVGAGVDQTATTSYYSGYMSEVYYIDGQQLTPSSFGQTDSATGIWTPIAYTGTYGTNGFYLKFANSAALGTDSSGNGNTFTVNNLTSVDQSIDSPTNNFATLNPLVATGGTYTEGNLQYQTAATDGAWTWSSITPSSGGNWYCEAKMISSSNGTYQLGLTAIASGFSPRIQYVSNGGVFVDGSNVATYATYTTNDIISMAYNSSTKSLTFYKNGVSQGSQTATSTDNYYFGSTGQSGGATHTIAFNFGSPNYSANSYTDANGFGNFSYAVPSGYYSLCSKNLAIYG
jgi:hypothetical protein